MTTAAHGRPGLVTANPGPTREGMDQIGTGSGRRLTLARALRGAPGSSKRKRSVWAKRQRRLLAGRKDRLKGQPQERQHSAAEGGTRGRLPPASDSRTTSRRICINFAFMI
jgi:hypothetical protein